MRPPLPKNSTLRQGFLQEVLKFLVGRERHHGYEWAEERDCLGFAGSVVVKVFGDYNPEPHEYHNMYGVIWCVG